MLQFIACAVHIAVLVDPSGNSIQHEFNRWIMLFCDFAVRHVGLLKNIRICIFGAHRRNNIAPDQTVAVPACALRTFDPRSSSKFDCFYLSSETPTAARYPEVQTSTAAFQ